MALAAAIADSAIAIEKKTPFDFMPSGIASKYASGISNSQNPKKVHDGGSDRVAGAVERLHHDHEVGVAEVAVADDAQTRRPERHDCRIA